MTFPGLRQLAGVDVGKVVRRLLKPVVLVLLEWCKDEVEENWQQGQVVGGVGVPPPELPGPER